MYIYVVYLPNIPCMYIYIGCIPTIPFVDISCTYLMYHVHIHIVYLPNNPCIYVSYTHLIYLKSIE